MAIAKVFVRSPYNYDVAAASRESGLECLDESLAVQSEAEDADINTIVKRFGLTGQLPENVRVPLASDFTEAMDFKSAMNAIRAAQESFAEMPAHVRERFQNDPEKFVLFCTAEEGGKLANLDEMRKLGLAVAAPEPVVPAVTPALRSRAFVITAPALLVCSGPRALSSGSSAAASAVHSCGRAPANTCSRCGRPQAVGR